MATTRDFDADRELLGGTTFTLGGHVFETLREVRPEAMMAYEALDATGDLSDTMRVMDDLIRGCVRPEHREMWDALRADESIDPIGIDTISNLAVWLIEQVVARPLGAPSGSSDGSEGTTTGTNSTVLSLSPEAVASAG